MVNTKNIIISGTNFWNPGDDFVRDGIISILKEMFPSSILNFLFYNFNADFFPHTKFSGISNTVQAGDLDKYKNHVDYIIIAGLSAGVEIKDLYTWILDNNLQDRVYLIGAGYENDYVDKYISQEPEASIFKNAKIITSRTLKRPAFIDKHNLDFHYINCPAILSVPSVRNISSTKKIERIGFSIQLPKGVGILNQFCSPENYNLAISILTGLSKNYEVEVVAHHKTEYFHFLELLKDYNIPVIFSSYYQDLFNIYPRYDLVVTTRLHSSLFANGFGIPGIIVNNTDRHTHCLQGFPHSVWVSSMAGFEKEFRSILGKDLQKISIEAHSFKQALLNNYIQILSKPFGICWEENTHTNPSRKMNLGCGFDYREGYINVDGNASLPKVDCVIDVKPGALKKAFQNNFFEEIVAKDFIEHHFHWEAHELLDDFFCLLDDGGRLDITLPNVELIIEDKGKPLSERLMWLYGGQDIGTPNDTAEQKIMRQKYSSYYCHKFGWTKENMKNELKSVGFNTITFEDQGWNMRVIAIKDGSSISENRPQNIFKEVSQKSDNYAAFDSEKKEQLLVRDIVKEGMTVLDVGANIGKYTKLFSHLVGEKGKVFAFEPSSFAYTKLVNDMKNENLNNVKLFRNAVYSKNQKITLNEFPEEFCSWNGIGKPVMKKPRTVNEIVPIVKSVEVDAITLDTFCLENNIKEIDYLKLDVEGAEIFALKGAKQLLQRKAIKYLQFEISKQMLEGLDTSAKVVFDFLNECGYATYSISENGKIGAKANDSTDFYENYIAVPQAVTKDLPINFFTIVLNGQPFIEKQIDILKTLPFQWHWHIIEGVAELKHDTAWSLQNGAQISDKMHKKGLSVDGTSAYLDKLAKLYPENVTVYRKENNEFWDGKLEMVNAPLSNISEESLLWQLDVDEFWLPWQISKVREMFRQNPEKSAAMFYCHYFVGEKLVTSTRNTYGNNSSYEWLRVWRFHPNNYFDSHEPPKLMHQSDTGQIFDKGTFDLFTHKITEEQGLVFEHYAYMLEDQLRFKEDYYGYKDAVKHWEKLQSENEFPALLQNYFPWVKDNAKVITVEHAGLIPLLQKRGKNKWDINDKKLKSGKSNLNSLSFLDSETEKVVLWIRADSIGDAILSMEMLSKFKKRYKNVKNIMVCQNHIKELYEAHPDVDEIIGFDKKLLLSDTHYQQQVVKILKDKKAYLAVNSVYSRDMVSDFLALNSNSIRSIAFEGDNCNLDEKTREDQNALYNFLVPVSKNPKKETDRNASLLNYLTSQDTQLGPKIFISKKDEEFAKGFFKRNDLKPESTLILFAGAQHEIKHYDKYGDALAQVCKDNGFKIIALGSKNEYELNQQNLDVIGGHTINLSGQTTILQAAALIKKSRMVVGSDTSMGHIAAAFNVPQVIVLGGGHFGRFMPIHKSTVVVSLPMDCFGCNWKCKFNRVKCIKDVPSTLLKYAIEQQLSEPNKKARLYIELDGKAEDQMKILCEFINPEEVEIHQIENIKETEQGKTDIQEQFFNLDMSSYYQPEAGNTEKYISVKPCESMAAPISSFQALKDYNIRDFGVGLDASVKILGHIVLNKFKTEWAGKSDFWLKTIVLPVKCDLSAVTTGKSFAETKPNSLGDIDPLYAKSEKGRLEDIQNYAQQIKAGTDLGKALYITGKALNELMQLVKAEDNTIYMLDGARRIAASALAHQASINILLIVHEQEYAEQISADKLASLKQKMQSLSWFNNYQNIPLIGLKGERTTGRFSLMDSNLLQGQTVMDFGCNTGQACLKAVQAGAKKVIGIEGMADTYDLAQDIKTLSGFDNLDYLNVDFNHPDFGDMIDVHVPDKVDYSFFFSVYRTRELTQRERLFHYIINKTQKGIFFEGHADPKIDSLEYYDWLFDCFGLKSKFLGYSEGSIRPLFYLPLQEAQVSEGGRENKSEGHGANNEVRKTPVPAIVNTMEKAGDEYPYLVSAIVSTYNSEKFIEGKLNDLLNQTLGDRLEIIVIDSASQESEKAVVEKYMQKHNNIKFLRTDQRETVYQAWNRGIKMAGGKYLTNSNTDDRLRKDALEVMAGYLEENNNTALVYGDFYITGYENQTFENHVRTGYSLKPDYDLNIMLHGCHMGPQPLWRKSIHENIGYFDSELKAAGDYDMWCRLAAAGFGMKHLSEFLGLYLHNADGIINSNQGRAELEAAFVRDNYRTNFPAPADNLPTGFYYRGPVQENNYVNICMVTYNRLEFSKQALQSILSNTKFPHVITVVDNNSTDGSKEYLKDLKQKGVIKNLILLDENVGVAKASNLAWKQEPEAQYYMKCDNDIVIQKADWLKNMVAVADGFPKAGMIGYNFEPYSYAQSNEFGLNVRIKEQGNLGGACVLIPKSTEHLLGNWCEDYGLYSEEDADYGFRIQLAGLKNIYMEDEDIGFHLPAGKAAVIDVNANFDARDGMEEEQDKEYRDWKDGQRREIIASGIRDRNFADYKSGQKSLFVESLFFHHWFEGQNKLVGDSELLKSTATPRIGFLTLDHYNYACPMIRLYGPLDCLGRQGEIEFVHLDSKEDAEATFQQIRALDILIVQRNLPDVLPYEKLLQKLGDNCPKIVYEFDDAFKQLEKGHVAYNYYSSFKDKIDEYLDNADLVTVSTRQLQKYYQKQNENIIVLPNLINENIWKFNTIKEAKPDKVRILFAGTPGHEPDLQVVKNGLLKLLNEFGEKVELLLWGSSLPELEKLDNVKMVDSFKLSYLEYAEKLQELNVDLAIVPLANTTFNKAKSHIKWLEYSACGIPAIFSKVGQYPSVVKNKKNGLLVANNNKAWYEAIKWLITHPDRRLEIATAAQDEVKENHTLAKKAHLWLEAYSEILSQNTSQNTRKSQQTVRTNSTDAVEVSIIIPVYNKLEYTKKCIDAVLKNTSALEYEIIVVDNASTDGTSEFLKTISLQESKVRVISNSKNAGFAGSNNQAVKMAKGKYILFLNNDTEALTGWLENMLEIIKNDDTVGAVGNKLLYADGTIQHGGVVIINDKKNGDPLQAQNIFVGQNRGFPDANQMREYQAVTAACMLTSKKMFDQVGGFDEQFWNGYEDVDFCFKLREAGYKIVYQPASEVVHHESKSGTERFAKVGENIRLLHKRWLNKVSVDFIIGETGDIQQSSKVQIKPYPSGMQNNGQAQEISGLVSIVMLTCNALEYTRKCVRSIQKNTQHPHEIIFVDNASSDGTQKYLRDLVKQNTNYKLIENKENKGFAAGNNQAVKEAKGEYVFFLNNDVLVSEGWLSDMVSAIEKDGAIGMMGPLTNNISGLQRLDNVPYKDDDGFDGFATQVREGNRGNVTPRRRIAGFAILMRKELYQEVEGFNETFGLGNFEDDDLCLKVREAGYAIMVHEGTFIHHFGSQSFKANGIDLIQSLKEKGTIFKENWPGVDYEELLEINNPLHVIHPKMINKAEEHLENGETESASDLFSKVLDENPVNGEALLGIALALRMEGHGEQAVPFLNAAFKHFPDNILIPNQLGMVAFEMGDIELAKSHFATAIQMNPSFLEAKRNYGQALIDSGDYENGVVAFTKILEKHPDDIISIVYMAGLYLEVGQTDRAQSFINKALEIDPKNPDVINLLDSMQEQNNETSFNPDSSILNERANKLLESFQIEQAEKKFQESYDLSENADALFGQALCASQKGLEIKTLSTLTKIIGKWPDYAPAYNQLGLLNYQNNEFENARDFFATAIEKDNTLLDAKRNYGLSLIELEDFQNGIAVFNKIIENVPDDVETLIILAGFYCETEKWTEAENFISAALENEPDNPSALELQNLIHDQLETV